MSIKELKNVGEKSIILFKKLNLNSVGDLITYYPNNYELWEPVISIFEAYKENKNHDWQNEFQRESIIRVKVMQEAEVFSRKNIYKLKAICDEQILNIVFINKKGIATSMKLGGIFLLKGEVKLYRDNFEILCPKVKNTEFKISLIEPIYMQTNGLPSWKIAKAVKESINLLPSKMKDTIPEYILKKFDLASLDFMLRKIHFPENNSELKKAKERLIFEELFSWQLALYSIKKEIFFKNDKTNSEIQNEDTLKNNLNEEKFQYRFGAIKDYSKEFIEKLPFELTNSQKHTVDECIKDMASENFLLKRLLQGDVGSGKTVIAMILIFNVLKNGYQCALMAPTEILAQQHYKNFLKFFTPFLEENDFNFFLVTSSTTKKERKKICEKIKEDIPYLVIGTHCLNSSDFVFKNLALTIVDEQHKFGVDQRTKLGNKNICHMLVMSATPIPRSLALCIYADFDLSILNELPPGRKPVKTLLLQSKQRFKALLFLKSMLKKGNLAYIVCSSIGKNDDENTEIKNDDNLIVNASNYKELFLNSDFLNNFRTEIIHSKMKSSEKEKIMNDFFEGKIKLLISTTVIEVGVDVPKANVMIIENAERFGLASLHQLRGRIGRQNDSSFCILISNKRWGPSYERLKVLKTSNDGFYLANQDLKQRGPGQFFGTQQHGKLSRYLIEGLGNAEILDKCNKSVFEVTEKNPKLDSYDLRFLRKKILNLLKSM